VISIGIASDAMVISSYNSTRGEVTDQEPQQTEYIHRSSTWRQYAYGVFLASLSGILFTANNFVINQTQVDVGDVVLVRTLLQISIYLSILLYRGESFLPAINSQKVYTILQGLTGSIAFICSLACVSFMDVPDALSIIFACPLVTIFLSAVMLRDRLSPLKICSGVLLLSGVILVCKPSFLFDTATSLLSPIEVDEKFTIGVVLACTACLSTGTMAVLVAKCEDVSTSVLVLWTAIIGLGIAVTYGLLHPGSMILSQQVVNIPAKDWAIFLGLALSGLLAFTTLTRSLKLISPNLVASLRTLELVLAFSVQSIVTGLAPGLLSCLGGGLIIIGILMLALQHQILSASSIIISILKEIKSGLKMSEDIGPTEYTSLLVP